MHEYFADDLDLEYILLDYLAPLKCQHNLVPELLSRKLGRNEIWVLLWVGNFASRMEYEKIVGEEGNAPGVL